MHRVAPGIAPDTGVAVPGPRNGREPDDVSRSVPPISPRPLAAVLIAPGRVTPPIDRGTLPFHALVVRTRPQECSRCDSGDTKVGAGIRRLPPARRRAADKPSGRIGQALTSWHNCRTTRDRGPFAPGPADGEYQTMTFSRVRALIVV